jgi:hypothetical protein
MDEVILGIEENDVHVLRWELISSKKIRFPFWSDAKVKKRPSFATNQFD